MDMILSITCIVLLGIIVFQDFKYRQIFWVTLPVLFLIFAAQSYFQNGFKYTALYFVVNLCFMFFIFLSGVLLVAVSKKRPLVETLKTFIGAGDLLFFLVLCAAFSPFMYLAYCGLSALLAMVGFLVFNSISKNTMGSSPFAGVMSLLLIFLIVIRQFNQGFDFYDDEQIVNLMRLV